jgi:streptomycin 6-kinase
LINEEKFSNGQAKLARVIHDWQLTADGEHFIAGNSLLQPVLQRLNGSESRAAMLKIPLSDKGEAGFRLLACWGGKAAVNVYRYDAGALLMERAAGDRSLRRMVLDGREDEANTIACGVVGQLHANGCMDGKETAGVLPLSTELPPLATWFRSLKKAAEQHGALFTTCQAVADKLLRDPQNQLALHGDIHYDNILDSGHTGDIHYDNIPNSGHTDDIHYENIPNSGHRGWVAIDPKGVIGERAFDYANLFCNPTIEVATSLTRLPRQVPLVAALAGLEPQRLLHWIIAWSGLMAAWMLEDAEAPTLPLLVAELALKELGIT